MTEYEKNIKSLNEKVIKLFHETSQELIVSGVQKNNVDQIAVGCALNAAKTELQKRLTDKNKKKLQHCCTTLYN